MVEKLATKEVSLEDCQPFFDMCQSVDQKLLEIEASYRRDLIRKMPESQHPPPPPDPNFENSRLLAIRYISEVLGADASNSRLNVPKIDYQPRIG